MINGMIILEWIRCETGLVSTENVIDSMILYSVIPNPVIIKITVKTNNKKSTLFLSNRYVSIIPLLIEVALI